MLHGVDLFYGVLLRGRFCKAADCDVQILSVAF
jgi:hypothetical protein